MFTTINLFCFLLVFFLLISLFLLFDPKKRKTIDRILSGSLWQQLLVLLWFSTLIVGCFHCLHSIFFANTGEVSSEWNSLLHFIDPGAIQGNQANPLEFLMAFSTSFLGLVLLGGLLISVFTNYYNIRIERFNKGLGNYSFDKHLLLLGYDHMALPLLKDYLTANPTGEVVIITEQNVEKINRFLRSHLIGKREKKVYVLQGARNIVEEIERASPHKAERVIILGEEQEEARDTKNMDCYTKLTGVLEKNRRKRNTVLDCWIHFEEQQTFRMAREYNLKKELQNMISFQPFNFYELWAKSTLVHFEKREENEVKKYLDSESLDRQSNKQVHVILMGFNRMAHALCVEVGRIAHYPNYRTKGKKTKITIVDLHAYEHELAFRNQYPGLDLLEDIEIEFKQANVLSTEVKDFTVKVSQEENTLAYIAVCFNNSEFALSVGMNLPKSLYYTKIPILIKQRYAHELHNQKPDNVFLFGTETIGLDFKAIDQREQFAIKYNQIYGDVTGYATAWDDLSQDHKWSNRYVIDAYPSFFRNINLHENEALEKYEIAELEHRRWCAERIFTGRIYGKEKDNDKKTHPLLKSFDQLEDDSQKLNRELGEVFSKINF